jgi:uncharacterized protein YajQ (UPF0234 family)
MVEHQHAPAALPGSNRTHEAGGTGADDEYVGLHLACLVPISKTAPRGGRALSPSAYTFRSQPDRRPPMPSFDVISEVDKHELTNAVDQANRELANRFDFKGADATYELDGYVITQRAPSDFQLQQMLDILRARLISRKIDVRALEVADPEVNLAGARQKITVKQGIEQPVAKKLVAELKAAKLKVEAQINGDKLRVTGKKRDDLQLAMALLRKSEVELPLQFDNFRD